MEYVDGQPLKGPTAQNLQNGFPAADLPFPTRAIGRSESLNQPCIGDSGVARERQMTAVRRSRSPNRNERLRSIQDRGIPVGIDIQERAVLRTARLDTYQPLPSCAQLIT